MYFLLIIAVVLFATQFLFNQQFRKLRGEGLDASLSFSLYGSTFSFLLMFILGGFKLHITWFSFLIAIIYAAACILSSYSGLKAFGVTNLSVYSIFSMLGGMLLPFAYGVLFAGEPFTAAKAVCILLIGIAILFSFEKGGNTGKGYLFCFSVFILNGSVGVLSKIHMSPEVFPSLNALLQSGENLTVDSYSFLATIQLSIIIACLVYFFVIRRKMPKLSLKEFGCVASYAGCNGIGNLFVQIALTVLPASVQYPIITGGVMVCSTLISFIRKEAITKKTYIATALALLSTILIMF